jgi:hypothetical protein
MTILPMNGLLRGSSKSTMRSAESPLSGVSFSSLLDTEEGISRIQQTKTFSFSELGVFGRHVAQVNRAMPVPEGGSGTIQEMKCAVDVPEAGVETDIATAAHYIEADAQHPTYSVTSRPASVVQMRAETSRIFSAPPLEEPNGVFDLSELDVSSPSRSAQTLAAAIKRAASASSDFNGKLNLTSVIISGPSTALTVLIRSDDNSSEARARLRRIVEQITSELGQRVAAVHMNGSPLEHTLNPLVGDANGYLAS